MRDIKFRGKRLDNGEWVVGYYIVSTGSDEPDEHIIQAVDRYYEVDPSTVGQFTGLQDKTGKDIYEGDITSTDIKRPYNIVVFRDGSFMHNCNDGGDDYYDIMVSIEKYAKTQDKYCEVIGNIHDNPELLKEA